MVLLPPQELSAILNYKLYVRVSSVSYFFVIFRSHRHDVRLSKISLKNAFFSESSSHPTFIFPIRTVIYNVVIEVESPEIGSENKQWSPSDGIPIEV